jgi:hypothetical protein
LFSPVPAVFGLDVARHEEVYRLWRAHLPGYVVATIEKFVYCQ